MDSILKLVRDIALLVDRNEYKRKQAAPGLKITSRAFGFGRPFLLRSVLFLNNFRKREVRVKRFNTERTETDTPSRLRVTENTEKNVAALRPCVVDADMFAGLVASTEWRISASGQ